MMLVLVGFLGFILGVNVLVWLWIFNQPPTWEK